MINLLWDAFCTASIVGIWPRYIEPNLLFTTAIDIFLRDLPKELDGFKIAQLSDLHFHKKIKDSFLRKILFKMEKFRPDLLVITGDFLCHSRLEDAFRLENFLRSLKVPYGTFAVFGNHDYSHYLKIDEEGDYATGPSPHSTIVKGFSRLICVKKPTGKLKPEVKNIQIHQSLKNLLENCKVRCLENQTERIKIGKAQLNITGIGEHMAARAIPAKAFKQYNLQFPGIVLVHNPDAIPSLQKFPGDLILCGHTHGGEINIPFLVDRLCTLENPQFRKGLHQLGKKNAYINRGIGGVQAFRWFSPPEFVIFTLKRGKKV